MKKLFCYVMLTGLSVSLTGCAGTSLMKTPAIQSSVAALTGEKKAERVSRILCLWESAEGQGLDEKPSRGFAGQLLFFEYDKPSPSPVNGIVKIHQYDRYDSDNDDQEPVHTFTFDSGAWDVHMAEGTLGHSYNVFIPYVKKHKHAAHCALQVEFIPENGRPSFSPITEISLQPRKSKTRSANESAIQRDVVKSKTERPEVFNAGYTESAHDHEEKSQLESVTIELPSASRRSQRRFR